MMRCRTRRFHWLCEINGDHKPLLHYENILREDTTDIRGHFQTNEDKTSVWRTNTDIDTCPMDKCGKQRTYADKRGQWRTFLDRNRTNQTRTDIRWNPIKTAGAPANQYLVISFKLYMVLKCGCASSRTLKNLWICHASDIYRSVPDGISII
jgi:hypothetical protein